VSSFEPRKLIRTAALSQEEEQGFPPDLAFLRQVLQTGYLPRVAMDGGRSEDLMIHPGDFLSTAQVFETFERWNKGRRFSGEMPTYEVFCRRVLRPVMQAPGFVGDTRRRKKGGGKDGERRSVVAFDSYPEARGRFATLARNPAMEWEPLHETFAKGVLP
jgi:hypothetical protein